MGFLKDFFQFRKRVYLAVLTRIYPVRGNFGRMLGKALKNYYLGEDNNLEEISEIELKVGIAKFLRFFYRKEAKNPYKIVIDTFQRSKKGFVEISSQRAGQILFDCLKQGKSLTHFELGYNSTFSHNLPREAKVEDEILTLVKMSQSFDLNRSEIKVFEANKGIKVRINIGKDEVEIESDKWKEFAHDLASKLNQLERSNKKFYVLDFNPPQILYITDKQLKKLQNFLEIKGRKISAN